MRVGGGGGDLLDVEAYTMVSFAHISGESILFCGRSCGVVIAMVRFSVFGDVWLVRRSTGGDLWRFDRMSQSSQFLYVRGIRTFVGYGR